MLSDIGLILPELVLFLGAMGLLMVGAFSAKDATQTVDMGAIALLLLAAILALAPGHQGRELAFNGVFVVDGFTALMKALTFVATAVAILMSRDFMKREKLARF